MDFLASELIPHIDSAYPTAPYRVFIGHSLGGLMAVDALVNHPGLFNAHLAIDPSMWWDKARLLRQVQAGGMDFHGASLFLAGANSLQPGLDTVSVMHDTATVFSRHMQSIFMLRNTLMRTATAEHLYFGWKYYPEYNHGSVPLVAEYDGLMKLLIFIDLISGMMKLRIPPLKGIRCWRRIMLQSAGEWDIPSPHRRSLSIISGIRYWVTGRLPGRSTIFI